jgi:hypothetical protein
VTTLLWRAVLATMLVLNTLLCVLGGTMENEWGYQECITSPSTCTDLYVPPPSQFPSRMRVARAQLSSRKVAATASV